MRVYQRICEGDKEVNFGEIGRLEAALAYFVYKLHTHEADYFNVCGFIINQIQKSGNFIAGSDPVIRIELENLEEGSNFRLDERCSRLICLTCDFGRLMQPNADFAEVFSTL